MNQQLRLTPDAVDAFPASSFLRAADITMQVPPQRHLPILPSLLHQICHLSTSLGALGPAMRVCMMVWGGGGMLRQSNLAPRSPSQFDPSRHTCSGNIIQPPPVLLIVIHWTKKHQTIRTASVLYIPEVLGLPADLMDAFFQLLTSSPSLFPDHLLLTYIEDSGSSL